MRFCSLSWTWLYPTVDTKFAADTGAQVDCISVSQIRKLGIGKQNLLIPGLHVDCANNTDAGIVGVFFGRIWTAEETGGMSVLFYVLEKGSNLLSKSTCEKLGIVQKDFPKIHGRVQEVYIPGSDVEESSLQGTHISSVQRTEPEDGLQAEGECDPDSPLPCRCPRRNWVDPPETIPFEPIKENVGKIEK